MTKQTIDLGTLKGFATQFAKSLGTTKGFKPYWKNDQGQTFYGFVESFGFAGTALNDHKTKFGYIVAHCDYAPKPANAPAAPAAPAKLATATLSPKGRPVLVKRNATTTTTPKASRTAKLEAATITRAQLDKLPVTVQVEIYRTLNANGIAIR